MVVRVVACISLLADTYGRDLDHDDDEEEEEEEEEDEEDEESAEEDEAGAVVPAALMAVLSIMVMELLGCKAVGASWACGMHGS